MGRVHGVPVSAVAIVAPQTAAANEYCACCRRYRRAAMIWVQLEDKGAAQTGRVFICRPCIVAALDAVKKPKESP